MAKQSKKEPILQKNKNYQKIATQINKLAQKDQYYRIKVLTNDILTETENKMLLEMDSYSTNFIKNIVKEIGLPTITKVGKKASFNAWLLVQHSPDLEFQKEYLALLKENKNDVKPANIAYLEDRILMYQNKPQIFGTQFRPNKDTGKMEPYTIEDPTNVNKRRADYGMETLEEHIKMCYSD